MQEQKGPAVSEKDFDPNVYVTYRHNSKAWMTSVVFTDWLKDFDRSMIQQKRKVLLLLDNAASHKVPEDLENVQVHFLPPNTTAHLQPNDAGIIRNFKLYYRKGLTKHFLQSIENDQPMAINLREALHLIREAWNYVKMETIQNCWEHTGIIPRASSAEITSAACGTEAEVVEEIQRDMQGFHTISSEHFMSVCDWLDVDTGICTGEVLSDEAIVEIVNPPTQRDSESESDHDETESPPRAVTTNEAISAISTLIYFFEQHSSLPKVTNYLDSAWAMKRNIQSFSKESLVQREITDFFK